MSEENQYPVCPTHLRPDCPLCRDDGPYARALKEMRAGVVAAAEARSVEMNPAVIRMGLNSALVDVLALSRLLLAKGIFTREEYEAAVGQAMRETADAYAPVIRQALKLAAEAEEKKRAAEARAAEGSLPPARPDVFDAAKRVVRELAPGEEPLRPAGPVEGHGGQG
jgi:hypothetical protein